MTFLQLLELAGGNTTQLAAKLNLHQRTVERWVNERLGIPKKYKNPLKELFKITDKQFDQINAALTK